MMLHDMINMLNDSNKSRKIHSNNHLKPIFNDESELHLWKERISKNKLRQGSLHKGIQEAFIGVDSGSTTTKIVVLNNEGELIFSFYKNNNGKPIESVVEGLKKLQEKCRENETLRR